MSDTKKTIQKRKKVLQGVIVSDKMEKTAVALVKRTVQHPLYKRTVRTSKKYKIHDEQGVCQVGDHVRLIECKRVSKHKAWRLLEIVRKAV
ncbi:MAG: 30S ribosomal protein S17 [SAR324 cluster bacterium]|nr:30S ribosomal protein S17 [SAR324 cluster bacterium]